MMNKPLLSYYISKAKTTHQELADNIGISRKSLSSKINGKSDFKVSEIEKICKILAINDDDITSVFFNGIKVTKNEHEWDDDDNRTTCGVSEHEQEQG